MLNLERFSIYRTGIMGFASIWILVMHSFLEVYPNVFVPIISHFFYVGSLGVEIFLILSGMSMFFSFNNNQNILCFYKKRLIRIVPTWILTSIPYWLIICYLLEKLTIKEFFLNFFGITFWTEGKTTIWYVIAIFIFYLIYPIIYKIQKANKLLIVGLMLIIIAFNVTFYVIDYEDYNKYEILTNRIIPFIVGSLIGEFVYKKELTNKWIMVLIGVGILLSVIGIIFNLKGQSIGLLFRLGGTGSMILLMFVISLILEKVDIINKILSFFGKISFELYLVNVFLRNILNYYKVETTTIKSILICTGLMMISILLSFIVYKIINKFQKILNK